MNGFTPTGDHVQMTSAALNVTLPVAKSVDDLRISHTEHVDKLTSGTVQDSRKIADFLEKKLGLPSLAPKGIKTAKFICDFWYTDKTDCEKRIRPSIEAEESWSSISTYYLSHQKFIFTNKEPLAEDITEPEESRPETQDLDSD